MGYLENRTSKFQSIFEHNDLRNNLFSLYFFFTASQRQATTPTSLDLDWTSSRAPMHGHTFQEEPQGVLVRRRQLVAPAFCGDELSCVSALFSVTSVSPLVLARVSEELARPLAFCALCFFHRRSAADQKSHAEK